MTDLLKCIICPKKPKFSDVSHLLTHIGSKGHLAHLHGLQVRSHQEIDAGCQLAVYNRWFQEHNVAALLSERMQQKQQKQADKKAANRRRMANVANCTKPCSQKASRKQCDLHLSSANSEGPVVRHQHESEDFSRADYFIEKAARYLPVPEPSGQSTDDASQYPMLASSPPKLYLESVDLNEEYGDAVDDDTDALEKTSPGSPKLKGTHWPGMALFDAATEDLKRKRNQRKDGSVLEKLERNAALVEPTETVHSANGTVLKHRHMDNLEDDSPVEGEELVFLPSPKKRKSRAPRARRHTNIEANRKPGRPQRRQLHTPVKIANSGPDSASKPVSHFSPLEDAGKDFKLAIRNVNRKRSKKQKFAVYEDSSPSFGVDGSAEAIPSTYVNANLIRPQMPFGQAWFRQQAESSDPFKLLRDRLPPTYSGFTDLGQGKENNESSFFDGNFSSHNQIATNPLLFDDGHGRFTTNDSYSGDDRLGTAIGLNSDPFGDMDALMPPKNPLLVAMEQLDRTEPRENGYQIEGSSTHHRQPLFAP